MSEEGWAGEQLLPNQYSFQERQSSQRESACVVTASLVILLGTLYRYSLSQSAHGWPGGAYAMQLVDANK